MAPAPVRIPSDVDREDTILLGLTVRQLVILTITVAILYAGWMVGRAWVAWPALVAVAMPVAILATAIALGERDGLSLDRLTVAALRQRLAPKRLVSAPEGAPSAPEWLSRRTRSADADQPPVPLNLAARTVTDMGVVDLGIDGVAVVALCGTVNFGLRTVGEQESLIAAFGRYLHSLTAPVQVLVRVERFDLSAQIEELREQATALPHPALEIAAHEHADFLIQLDRQHELLRRQVLLVLREPLRAHDPTLGLPGLRRGARTGAERGGRRAAESRLARRIDEAIRLLRPAGIAVTPLDAATATGVLASACNPERRVRHSTNLAGAGEVITGPREALAPDDRDTWDPDDERVQDDEGEPDRWDDDEYGRYGS
ncbi:PrgI family protein [Embleya sp. NPDC055664]